MGVERIVRRSVLRNSVTLQPSLHCSLTAYEAHFCGASLDCPPFKPLSFESRLMPTIALVDDDRNILTSVSIALEAEGYRIMTYTDGASALDGFRTSPPDLAILDIKMPRMDGMETLRRLRQKSDLPVIFLTSKDEEIDELFGLKMGADDFIRKPFSQRLLVERVAKGDRRQGSGPRVVADGSGAPHLHLEERAGHADRYRISDPAGAGDAP